jgi:hypothetical protein
MSGSWTNSGVTSCLANRFGASIRCEIPGGKPIRLRWARAGRADSTRVEMVLGGLDSLRAQHSTSV